jgi:AraC-like DNA-binding protein
VITLRPKRLQPYVDKIVWQGSGTIEPFTVYPDIYHVMGIQNIGKIALVSGEQVQPLEPAGLTGIHHKPKMFQTTSSISSVLVYFRPEALFKWRLCSPKDLANTSISLTDLGMHAAAWDRLMDPSTASNPLKFLNDMEEMIWGLFKNNEIDPWANWVVNRIYSSKGTIRVGRLAEESTLSRRQFERRFVERIGTSPKSLAQIMKFQHVLQSMKSVETLTQLAYDADYYDQSHFIKEFRMRSGTTPRQIHHSEFMNRS